MLTWGAGTSEVITKNLPSDLRPLVNMCLLAKALLSFPLPFYSAAEILQSCLLTGEHTFAIRRTDTFLSLTPVSNPHDHKENIEVSKDSQSFGRQ